MQALQRKHEALERDLAALEDKVNMDGGETKKECGVDCEVLTKSYTQGMRKGKCVCCEQGGAYLYCR